MASAFLGKTRALSSELAHSKFTSVFPRKRAPGFRCSPKSATDLPAVYFSLYMTTTYREFSKSPTQAPTGRFLSWVLNSQWKPGHDLQKKTLKISCVFLPANFLFLSSLSSYPSWVRPSCPLSPFLPLSALICSPAILILTVLFFFFHFRYSFFFLNNFYWGIVALQCCISFSCTEKWFSHMYTYIALPWVSTPFRSPQSIE